MVADRYPDFIVIIPSIGLLVIGVKGWHPNAIERADAFARRGTSHRLRRAGSGKTVILAARARLVAADAAWRVLILCYNRALGAYFQQLFADTDNGPA